MLIRFSLRYFESNLKKSISYVFIVMCPLLFISCLSNSDSQAEGKEDVKKNMVKWKVNEETNQGIQNMMNMINNFHQTDDISSFKKLEKDLSDEYRLIFKNCSLILIS